MRRLYFIILLGQISLNALAQFPPPAGVEGTTAIHQDSSIIVAWAKSCQIQRGYLDIAMPDSGFVDFGEVENGVGQADQAIVSLGDGGTAILEFEQPIINGPGPDFAIFENSFSDEFLELALVYVSSNGVDYDLFPAISLTQSETQVEGFGTLDATKIHNLAGKYRMAYGTPFDLEELEAELGKEINQITHIKIVDVIGSINEDFASFDSQGNIINDPYPTPFPSGGFDLDAVGVIHHATATHELIQLKQQILVYPNPSNGRFYIENRGDLQIQYIIIFNVQGQVVYESRFSKIFEKMEIDLPQGSYLVKFISEFGSFGEVLLVF
ncbi:MAG: T9SS type A sorting domain-containing protein [Bacteroidales bacterium]|nr:T9SS type A sorting domain-containing protein [Bacteroidales bacterium]